ncbi:MAG: biotin/lipoyl-containing protein [Candidatus Heimdallarchaeaceae archaeon]
MKKKISFKGREYIVEILEEGKISIDGEIFSPTVTQQIENFYKVNVDGYPFTLEIKNGVILVNGEDCSLSVKPFLPETKNVSASQETKGEIVVTAPIPGKVVHVLVKENEIVEKNQELLILEAMKMRNRIFSPRNGKIASILVKEDETVEQDQKLLVIS